MPTIKKKKKNPPRPKPCLGLGSVDYHHLGPISLAAPRPGCLLLRHCIDFVNGGGKCLSPGPSFKHHLP